MASNELDLKTSKMQQNEQNTGEAEQMAVQMAEHFAGRVVTVCGVGGTLCYEEPSCSHNQVLKTKQLQPINTRANRRDKFVVERVPDSYGNPLGRVAFRVLESTDIGSGKSSRETETTSNSTLCTHISDDDGDYCYYLTNVMYGDEVRQRAADGLAGIPSLPAEIIPGIVEHVAGRATNANNFEGAGFDYTPMRMQKVKKGTPPNKMQQFIFVESLEDGHPARFSSICQRLGVKSLFGTYWRSQHWDQVVSQSSHMLGDETWRFYYDHDNGVPPKAMQVGGDYQRWLNGNA